MGEKEKVEVDRSSAYLLLHPMHTVLVSCVDKNGEPNIITLAWAMPTSIDPPMVAVSIAPARRSHALIEETGEFVVNIPTMDILDETMFCGTKSGRTHDKFKETGLTPLPAERVKAPLIRECVAHLECKLRSQISTGDHTIFVGEVVRARADENAFKRTYSTKRAKMIFHLGGNRFATLKQRTSRPKRLVRR